MTADELIQFEADVIEAFEAKQIKGPIHLSGGNEAQLIEIFKRIDRSDWIFTTYRGHYHALLHGIPSIEVMRLIVEGKSMNLSFPQYRFWCSAIVAGCLPIAVGVAAGIKRNEGNDHVWCFVGDMAARTGAFHEATQYARGHLLPITFVVEDNGMSCDSPTAKTWGDVSPDLSADYIIRYGYERKFPHVGTGTYVAF